jgi:hypothetical protein
VVIAMLLGGAALAAVARRINAPYPALVALAGAALGATTGWALPWLLHRPEAAPPPAVRLVPAPGGLALVF